MVRQNILDELEQSYLRSSQTQNKRMVFASSNHTHRYGMYGRESYNHIESLTSDAPYRPSSFYGVSKITCEQLGQYYASIRKSLQFVSIRVGALQADPYKA